MMTLERRCAETAESRTLTGEPAESDRDNRGQQDVSRDTEDLWTSHLEVRLINPPPQLIGFLSRTRRGISADCSSPPTSQFTCRWRLSEPRPPGVDIEGLTAYRAVSRDPEASVALTAYGHLSPHLVHLRKVSGDS